MNGRANFRTVANSIANGEVLIPIIKSYLFNPKFPKFEVKIKGFVNRKPDGWFHPSTHPLWPERMLYYYLTAPDDFVSEPYDPISAMTVTQGQFWHAFLELCLLDCGYLKAANVPVSDPQVGSRGELDGETFDDEVYELKTMRTPKAQKIVQGAPDDPAVIASFRALMPNYYAQGQEYMRLSGHRKWRGLFLSPEWPFPMREIAMPYDELLAYQTKAKYLKVRQAVADQRVPMPCCNPWSKESKACPMRTVCPVGMMS